MTLPRDLHKCAKMMGLGPDFDTDQLRRSYLRGCKKLAPDKGGDTRKFQDLQRVHALLVPYARRVGSDQTTSDMQQCVSRLQVQHDRERTREQPGKRYATANAAYEAIHGGSSSARTRGHGQWLKSDVAPELRPPDRIPFKQLNSEFERIRQAANATTTVSTHVIAPMLAYGTVGSLIDDADEDFTSEHGVDLQRAFGVL